MSALDLARRLVTARFPRAVGSLLAGSALTADRTPTSDLDVVVFLDGPPAPFRETLRFDGRLVELFVQTRESYATFVAAETARRRSPLLHMCAEGHVLTDSEGSVAAIQDEARRALAAGPPPLADEEREDRRYALTNLLDDLLGCRDDAELVMIGAQIVTGATELALLDRGSWLGRGKWLARRLRAAEPELAERLIDAFRRVVAVGDRTCLAEVTRDVLDEAGGPLADGYRRHGSTVQVNREVPR